MQTTALLNIPLLWQQSDLFIKFITCLLLTLSICSWSIILIKSYQSLALHKLQKQLNADSFEFMSSNFLSQLPNISRTVYGALITEKDKALKMTYSNPEQLSLRLEQHLMMGIQRATEVLQQGLALLATITSSAPFIGLLGTVWGIYRTLQSFSGQGMASIDQISGPMSEALLMTAFGLFVALPALIFYNLFTQRNKRLTQTLKRTSIVIHSHYTEQNSTIKR